MTEEQKVERQFEEVRQPLRGAQQEELTREQRMALTPEQRMARVMTHGTVRRTLAERNKYMKEEFGFRIGEKAEYVILESCNTPFDMHDGVKALKNLLDYFELDYTLLPKPYCCSSFMLSSGVKAHDREQVSKASDITRSIAQKNIEQAKALGAKTFVLVCQGCDTVYRLHKDSLDMEIIWFPELIERFFTGGKLQLKANYYAGCYRYDTRLDNPNPANLGAALEIMGKIQGLQLYHTSNQWCCKKPKELAMLVPTLKYEVTIATCCGCYAAVSRALGVFELHGRGNNRVKLLPEVVWDAVRPSE